MIKYKISDLERLSGVKSHTIRIWEQRYKLLKPLRSESNIRYYDNDQMRKLLNVVSLQKAGFKISVISKLTDNEINDRLESINNVGGPGIKEESIINKLISASLTYNDVEFETEFNKASLSFGIKDTYSKILYPMLNKIGLLWLKQDITPAQEHFVSQIIKRKLFSAIDVLEQPKSKKKKWILFLPENEQHELGLLMANYNLKYNENHVIYLGPDLPTSSLMEAIEEIKPNFLLTFVVKENQQKEAQNLLDAIAKKSSYEKAYLCCSEELKKTVKTNAKQDIISTYKEFEEKILTKKTTTS